MTEIEEVKKARTAAKRKVTLSVKKLQGALQRGTVGDTLKNLSESLEKDFYDLTDLHLQALDLGEEDQGYLLGTEEEFNNVMKELKGSLTASEGIRKKQEAAPLRKTIERGFISVEKILIILDRLLEEKDRDPLELGILRDDLDRSLNNLLDCITKLGLLEDTQNLDSRVDNLLAKSEITKRKVSLCVKKGSMSVATVDPILVEGESLSSNTGTETLTSSHSTVSQGATSVSPAVDLTNTTSQVDSLTLNTTGQVDSPASNIFSQVDSLAPNTSSSVCPLNPFATAYSMNLPVGHSQQSVVFDTKGNVITSALQTQPLMAYGYAPPSTAAFFPPPLSNMLYPGHGTSSETPQNVVFSPGHSAYSETIHTKKPSLPMFSGERADWPEFKCVWRPLAEGQFRNKIQLAMELKRCCKGKAADKVRHIYVTSESAYQEIWARLSEEYDDPGLSSQAAINQLMSLRAPEADNYQGIVKMIDAIEGIHSQLKELDHLSAVHTLDVDRVSMLLPKDIRVEWFRRYRDLPQTTKTQPFSEFVSFLRRERSAIARLAEWTPKESRSRWKEDKKKQAAGLHTANSAASGAGKVLLKGKGDPQMCIIHGGSTHTTADCRNFRKLPIKQRYEELRKTKRCFKCFEDHPKSKCTVPACKCGKEHHVLLCSIHEKDANSANKAGAGSQTGDEREHRNTDTRTTEAQVTGTNLANAGTVALYPICQASLTKSRSATVFFDGGSNASYVTTRCAQRSKLKRLDKVSLNVTTIGGKEKEYDSNIYEMELKTTEGKLAKVVLYELPSITGKVSLLDSSVVEGLFPKFDPNVLIRNSQQVDVLLGTDYFGLHPKQEIARAGDHLSVMKGDLGVCLVGTHPLLKESTELDSDVPRTLHLSEHRVKTHHVSLRGEHPAFSMSQSFIAGEDLGTSCSPKCGGCKCGKCPLPGHHLSFREEQELHLIRSGLKFDAEESRWISSYPWVKDPSTLPDNYLSALATLKATERSLTKDPVWAESYQNQMQDMVDRGVARKLSSEELEEWKGPTFYISHLAVANDKSTSTPVRMVFNSSQTFKGVSLNSYLAKGPDSYMNNILGLLLRWKENHVAVAADIKKMFHSVKLAEVEIHCHRFLWRDLDTNKEPDVYVILRVSMGDKPAPAIATIGGYVRTKF